MSAQPFERRADAGDAPYPDDPPGEQPGRPPVVIRRRAGLAALLGATGSAVAIAYLWRASQSGAPADWALCLLMALIGGYYLGTLLDSRTPLAVADELGVRIRLGSQWRGLPWQAVRQVAVRPGRGPLRDGRLVFVPHSPGRALDGLEPRARRQAAANERVYGAALAVPLGLTTRITGSERAELADRLAALTGGAAAVVTPAPEPTPERPVRGRAPEAPSHEPARDAEPGPVPPVPSSEGPVEPAGVEAEQTVPAGTSGRSLLGGLATIVSRVGKGRSHDVDTRDADAPAAEHPAPAVPLRSARPALRAEVSRDVPATRLGGAAEEAVDATEGRELRRPGSVDLVFEPVPAGNVRPIAQAGEAVAPLVIDDFAPEPAYDPVIGPELAAARNRLGLSVDDLAERTRIRPHVIESIEVDDFAPCGGDFYARGHLRTLARVLGKDPAPLLAQFESRYATAPVDARRVFEAELATGMTGSIRSTVGGQHWGLLVGVVLSLALVWGVVRLFAAEPTEVLQPPGVMLNGSAGVHNTFGAPARPVALTLSATGPTRVVVRDGDGTVVFAERLRAGQDESLRVAPPVRVRAGDAGAVRVQVRGRDLGALGEAGEPGRRTFARSAGR